jgi:hypothetical protein
MSEIKVIIPSAGRFMKPLSTLRHIANATVVVPETEVLYYRRANPGANIIEHPEEIKGMGNKRNWIMDQFGDVFMLDDDLAGIRKNCVPFYEKVQILSPLEAYDLIQFLGDMCRQMGAVLFGFGNATNMVMFKPQEPFRMSGYINGASLGMLQNNRLRFNPEIVSANDYYISALNAYHYRRCLKDMRFVALQKGVGNTKGGMARVKTPQTERNDSLLLRKYFGEAIRPKNVNNKNYRSKNKYGRVLQVPF